MNPIISVIIPTYNRADFLVRTIESVLDQTYPYCEIIIIDDGSTDATQQVMERFFQLPNFYYYYQENQGRSVARNFGMNKATGEYLMFLDSDDLLAPAALETLIETAQNFPESGVVGGGRFFINERDEILQVRDETQIKNEIFAEKVYLEKIREFFLPPSTYIIKKSLASQLNGFNPLYEPCEDLDFFLRYCDESEISVLKKTVVYMRRHEGNTPHQHIFDGIIKIAQHNVDLLKSNPQKFPTNLRRQMQVQWQLKMADDFYVTGNNTKALRHYLNAIGISPDLLFDRNTMKCLIGTWLPENWRGKIKSLVLRYGKTTSKPVDY